MHTDTVVIYTRLVVEAAVKTINELCYICDFSDARRKIPGVTTILVMQDE